MLLAPVFMPLPIPALIVDMVDSLPVIPPPDMDGRLGCE
jgi:hypothetical protein